MALRGRFLVGSRPVDGDVVRRFVASAAENGIDVFRLHDPLNDVSNLREAAEAIAAAEREFDAGLVYSPGATGETDELVEQARKLPELGAERVVIHDPTGSLQPHRASELVARVGEASGLPVGLYCQGSVGNGLAAALEAARSGADLLACAVYPVALTVHRVSGEGLAQALTGLGYESTVDVGALWHASELIDEHLGDAPVTPLAPRVAARAAEHALPAGLVAALDTHLRAHAAGDRIDEVLQELERIRVELGSPPLAAPIGQILASQALLHVLSASRWVTIVDEVRALVLGRYGTPPGSLDPTVQRAVSLVSDGAAPEERAIALQELRSRAAGLAASEEELLLLGLFGEEAEPLLHAIRGRTRDETLVGGAVDQARAEKIREVVRIVQESGVAELTIEEEDGLRVTVRRTEEAPPVLPVMPAPLAVEEPDVVPVMPRADGLVRVESPMVGTFFRAPEPGAPPFVEVGRHVEPDDIVCIVEVMKLMTQVGAGMSGTIVDILVANGEPVEKGQPLFTIQPSS
jgi:oxaloacetate decarboxylase alpha subunit